MLALVVTLIFILCLASGVPISLALGVPTVVYFVWMDIPIQMIVQRMFSGIDNFTLLAIPFFMFAGRVMNEGGITERIVDFSKAITGAVRGGLAMVNVVASMLFAGISGAATADVASIGAVLIPAMKKDGYTAEYSVAITAMSSIIGPIIPPSIVFILYGVLSGTSIIGLFIAGIIPGIMLGLAQIVIVYLEGRKHHFPAGEPTSLRFFARSLVRSGLSMILPVIIIGGMLAGVFTATEAGAVAAFYALFLSMVVYKKLKPSHLWGVLRSTALDTANVMVIVGTSSIFAWMLAAEDIPERVGTTMMSISQNPAAVLLMINVLLLFIGTFMDNFPAMIITLPVLLPLVKDLGVSPLHFGVIMTVNLMIGTVTPPVGMCIYLGAAIGKTTVERAAFAMKWLLLVSIAILLLVTYVPSVSMFLPHLLGFD
jgi:C4-dicarboxylate transporter DctM subunit